MRSSQVRITMNLSSCPTRELIKGYAQGDLSLSTIAIVAQHLENCPRCLAIFDEMLVPMVEQMADGNQLSPFAGEADRELARVLALKIPNEMGRAESLPLDHAEQPEDRLLQLGEYRLLEPIGQGGMGTVYRALHTQMNRVVAIKRLPRWCHGDDQAIERFMREIDMVAQLDHPNIVRAFDAREADGETFLVTEYVPGLDVGKLKRRCDSISPADACEIVRQACVALQFVHEHHLVHRDVKPSNLILSTTGVVKLLDLGLALIPGHAAELTNPGQLMGTLDYMAPEQATDSHDVDIRADVYGLGATLYKLLSGHSPLPTPPDASPARKLAAVTRGRCVSIRQRVPDVPVRLARTLHRALQRRPKRRYCTPEEFASDLEPFCAGNDLVRLIARAERADSPVSSSDESMVSTSRIDAGCAELTLPKRSFLHGGFDRGISIRSKKVLWWLAAAVSVLLLAGIVIRIRHGQQVALIRAPDNSKVEVDVDSQGDLNVDLDVGPPLEVPLALSQSATSSMPGWHRHRYDLGGTSFYPFPSRLRTSHRLRPTAWKSDRFIGWVQSIVTGDLTGDGYPEIIVRDANTVVVFDRWAKELWRRAPVIDSRVPVPVGREGIASNVELVDVDQNGDLEIVVLAGSEIPAGWSHKAPQSAVVYDGDGAMLKTFSILEGTTGVLDGCFESSGDGRVYLVLTIAAYRHPHAACIYDMSTGQLLLRIDFSDNVEVAGIGDMDKDGELDLYLLQSFTCHVDPPVDDYDSDHCYATRYARNGTRQWRQVYDDAIEGALVDMNGDDLPELLLINDRESHAELHLLDPETGVAQSSFLKLSVPSRKSFSVANLTGDDSKEVVIGDTTRLVVLDDQARLLSSKAAPNTVVLATNDLDGDGRAEIVAGHEKDLLILNGKLEELDRYTMSQPISGAIITDISGDGVNEVIVSSWDGTKSDVRLLHFVRRLPDEVGVDLKQPREAVVRFMAAMRQKQFDRAFQYVESDHHSAIQAGLASVDWPSLNAEIDFEQTVHIDDAEIVVPTSPSIVFRLSYFNDRSDGR
jgi:serine/threonine protein kinase